MGPIRAPLLAMKVQFLETTYLGSKLYKKGQEIEATNDEVRSLLDEGLAIVVEFDEKPKQTRVVKKKSKR
jgi:ribulose bisphosphate carboxylase small subunit